MCAISRIHNGLKVVFCFRHATPSHYHHDAWLPACVEGKNAWWVYHVNNVSKMEFVLSINFLQYMGCMCSYKCRWLKGYIHNPSHYHHQIASIHFSHYHIFRWLCVWNVWIIIFCHLLHIHPGTPRPCFHYWCAVYVICKRSDTLWPVDGVLCLRITSSHCRHYADVSEGIVLTVV